MPQAVIVDDDPDCLELLANLVSAEGFSVGKADTLRAARRQLAGQPPDVLITDLVLPDGEGIEIMGDLESDRETLVVVITGHASLDSAINALRCGAHDYLCKPVDVDRLRTVLRRVPRPQSTKADDDTLLNGPERLGHYGALRGTSPRMRELFRQLERASCTSATVMLVGESGTGKELCAQTIHEASARKLQPFLAINCGAVSPNLIESELFGHEKGGVTVTDRQHRGYFERACGGTLLLDEITEMPMDLQAKVLRALETGTFARVGTTESIAADVRVIAATNCVPERAVADGRLNEDLYHRLNVISINIPPLRARGADIELLAKHFLAQLNVEDGRVKTFAPGTIARLYAHSWPGNVRELKNFVRRAYLMTDDVIGDEVAARALLLEDCAEILSVRVGSSLEEVERRLTLATLASCDNVKRKAAEMLGISLKTLYNRLEYYATKGLIDPSHQALPARFRNLERAL